MIPLGVLASSYVAPAGSSWTPADLTGLWAWFDASDTSTITDDTGLVSAWADKGPNGYTVSQSTADAKPTTGTRTINSLNVLDLDGGDLLTRASAAVSQPFTFAIVATADAPTTNGRYVNLRDNGALFVNADSATKVTIYGSSVGSFNLTNAGMDLTAAHLTTAIFNEASSSIRYNGGAYTATGTLGGTIYPGQRIIIGDAGTTPGGGFDGAIAEVVIALGGLTGTDLTNLETYLTTKWGI